MKRAAILIWIKNETVREHRDAPRIAADFEKLLVEGVAARNGYCP